MDTRAAASWTVLLQRHLIPVAPPQCVRLIIITDIYPRAGRYDIKAVVIGHDMALRLQTTVQACQTKLATNRCT